MASQPSSQYNPLTRWTTRDRQFDYKGYVLIKVPEHPKSFRGGWYYEHRLLAEKYLGRLLETYETVHHLNENKSDNTELNLFVCTRTEHNYAHALTLVAA